jgi:hypothetical protein
MAIRSGITRVRHSSQLPFSFLKHAGLYFELVITIQRIVAKAGHQMEIYVNNNPRGRIPRQRGW